MKPKQNNLYFTLLLVAHLVFYSCKIDHVFSAPEEFRPSQRTESGQPLSDHASLRTRLTEGSHKRQDKGKARNTRRVAPTSSPQFPSLRESRPSPTGTAYRVSTSGGATKNTARFGFYGFPPPSHLREGGLGRRGQPPIPREDSNYFTGDPLVSSYPSLTLLRLKPPETWVIPTLRIISILHKQNIVHQSSDEDDRNRRLIASTNR